MLRDPVWPLVLLLIVARPVCAAELQPADIEFFEQRIRPVLVRHCYECHSQKSKALKGGLLLDSRDALLRGGDTGAAIVPGKPDESLLLKALRYEDYEMPPQGKLPDSVIADFRTWIELGAPDPRVDVPDASAGNNPSIDLTVGRRFWSFQPPQRYALPAVKQPDWATVPIDAFVLSRLEAQGLDHNSEADRRVLIRRATFDLTGLPPPPEEVNEFLSDTSPDAYDRLVDRLLSSPQFGERWARLWLDLMRYAEDQAHIVGNDTSLCYPNAYLYRDWVIRAFNSDLPYDEFVRLQLAADFVAPDDATHRPALGFVGLGPKYYRRNAPDVMAEEWEDRVDTVSRGLLGLTAACARCHDHKYDPIPTEDYYALAGVFASTEMFNQPLDGAEVGDNGQAKKAEAALHIVRDAKVADLNIHIRGDVTRKGDVVPRHFLQVLCESSPQSFKSGSGRRELAEAIANRVNPLTARVFVNRVWGQMFGRPLVGTPSNFGALGERPTHPELLDDLAVRFMDSGWSLKWLLRELALSATYRQSSDIEEHKLKFDPGNQLLGRMNRRRLQIEQWRDAVLAATGRLDQTVFGKSIDPDRAEQGRRTVYARVSRLELNSLLARFDFPDPNAHSDRRVQTTTPLQKLFALNSPFMVTQADALTQRLAAELGEDDAARIRRAYSLLFSRSPSDEELQLALNYVGDKDAEHASRWFEYAQALLASNEFLMLD